MSKSKWAIGILFIVCLSINGIPFGRGFPLAILTPLWAQEQGKQISGTEDGVVVRCEMYLMGKTGEGVIISEELFRILPSTMIVNNEGKKITLRELKVPSMAFVEYSIKTDNSTPTIISLELLSESQKSIEKKNKVGKSIKHFLRNSKVRIANQD